MDIFKHAVVYNHAIGSKITLILFGISVDHIFFPVFMLLKLFFFVLPISTHYVL